MDNRLKFYYHCTPPFYDLVIMYVLVVYMLDINFSYTHAILNYAYHNILVNNE